MNTVLIVEEDDATRELYERELGRSFRILASGDADHSLKLLQSEAIDAVVLEPAISHGAGWSLMETLRDAPARRPPRVILCSALDERRRGLGLGAAAYLVKPVLPVTLLDTIYHVLQD